MTKADHLLNYVLPLVYGYGLLTIFSPEDKHKVRDRLLVFVFGLVIKGFEIWHSKVFFSLFFFFHRDKLLCSPLFSCSKTEVNRAIRKCLKISLTFCCTTAISTGFVYSLGKTFVTTHQVFSNHSYTLQNK